MGQRRRRVPGRSTGVARARQELPPELPFRWKSRVDGDSTLFWRYPFPDNPRAVLTVAIVLAVPLVLATLLLLLTITPIFLLPLAGLARLHTWARNAVEPVGDGWRVAVGWLETVRVDSLEGLLLGDPCRVVALELDRRKRLHAVLENGERLKIMNRGTGVAGWLADRADVPLRREPTGKA